MRVASTFHLNDTHAAVGVPALIGIAEFFNVDLVFL
jgi:hypothetical protein